MHKTICATFCISIHALCEEGDTRKRACLRTKRNFYPRPLRGGRRPRPRPAALSAKFLSTPSARRATSGSCLQLDSSLISIHALCEEGDPPSAQSRSW